MQYKSLIKSRALRFRVLKQLSWVPDPLMVSIQYAIKQHRLLNLENPTRFTELLQWYKIHHRDPMMTKCVDKLAVREFVRERGHGRLLTNVYATAPRPEDLDLGALPSRFVLKTNNGSGTTIVVSDKKAVDEKSIAKMEEWLSRDYFAATREWPYKDVAPQLFAEEYLEDPNGRYNGLNDYKIYCFNGEPALVQLVVDRQVGEKFNFYTTDWKDTDVERIGVPKIPEAVSRPENLSEMLEVARDLSKDFPFVRVDLYSVAGRVYFGEMTFFPGSGYVKFSPDEFDYSLGKLWISNMNPSS